jgi:SAM-dependent methyltransferase
VRDSRAAVVRAGYDSLAERYLAWSAAVVGDPRDRFLADLAARLPSRASVLDLGCGAGVPSTQQLAERFEVTGVDISLEQVRLARSRISNARFICCDLMNLELAAAAFDAITGLYVISHIPREYHAALFGRVARWLKPGGLFLASLGARGCPDWTGEWQGVQMFFSSHDADTNRRLLAAAGLRPILDEVVTMREPEGDATFLWILARTEGESA